jgi:hypothetical protein
MLPSAGHLDKIQELNKLCILRFACCFTLQNTFNSAHGLTVPIPVPYVAINIISLERGLSAAASVEPKADLVHPPSDSVPRPRPLHYKQTCLILPTTLLFLPSSLFLSSVVHASSRVLHTGIHTPWNL